MAISASPSRRVLGEKNPNASLRLLSQQNTSDKPSDPAILKSPISAEAAQLESTPAILASPRTGRKRRISEVDLVSPNHRTRQIVDDHSADAAGERVTDIGGTHASQERRPCSTESSMTLAQEFQDEQYTLDTQFDLPTDEMSQRTLDKMHAVPLPQNDSQPQMTGVRLELYKEDSQNSSGMSSFVDFGGSDASQGNGNNERVEIIIRHSSSPRETNQVTNVPDFKHHEHNDSLHPTEETRKTMVQQKAAELRTRLQFAYFKVQTNQTTTSFARLKVPESMKRPDLDRIQKRPSQPANPMAFSIDIPAPRQEAQHDAVVALENTVSAMRAKATAQDKPSIRALESIPVPSIQPTAFSARYSTIPPPRNVMTDEEESPDLTDLPSSPPLSVSDSEQLPISTTLRNILPDDMSTPKRPMPAQLSSPPPTRGNSEAQDGRATDSISSQHGEKSSADTRPVPSSAVKGEAADSLLQLMRGVEGGRGMCGY